MFAAPPTLKTEIFARVPDHLRAKPHQRRPGVPHDCFLEGPSFDRAGNFYCVDIYNGRILKVTPGGEVGIAAEYDGEPNGLKIHRDGRIFIADHKTGLMLMDPASGAVTALIDRPRRERFRGLNDLIFAGNGDLYFTDQGQSGIERPNGRLFRLRANGRLELLLECIPSPNGLVLSRDETILYLAVTRTNSIWRVPLNLTEDESVSRVGVFINLSGGIGPDGLAIDEEGSLVIAHVGLGTVWVFDRLGVPLWRIPSCAGLAITNVAYGGKDRKDLYITESETGQILVAHMPVAGRAMFSHME